MSMFVDQFSTKQNQCTLTPISPSNLLGQTGTTEHQDCLHVCVFDKILISKIRVPGHVAYYDWYARLLV